MNKTSKALITSFATIALSASMIAGSALALFTSESKTNIAITSGKVNVQASVDESTLKGFSAEWQEGAYQDKEVKGTFTDGGTYSYDSGTNKLTLERLAAGDGVEFDLKVVNNSTIAVRYQVQLTVSKEDAALVKDLAIYVVTEKDGDNWKAFGDPIPLGAGESFMSAWCTSDAPEGDSEELTGAHVRVQLPIGAEQPKDAEGNPIEASCALTVGVLAVQGNAAPCTEEGGGHFVDASGKCIFCGKKVELNKEITNPTTPKNNQEWWAFRDAIKNASDTVFDITFSEDYASNAPDGAASKFTVQNNNEVTLNLGDYHLLSSKSNTTNGKQIFVNNASLTINANTPTYSDPSFTTGTPSTVGNVNVDGGVLKLNGGYYTHHENVAHDSGLIAGLNGSTIEIKDGLFYAKTNKSIGSDGAVIYSASGSKVNVAGGFYFGGGVGVFHADGGNIAVNGNITFGGTGIGSGSAPWFCAKNGGEIRILNTITITYYEKKVNGYNQYTITPAQLKEELTQRCGSCTVQEEGQYIVIKAGE